MEVIFGNNNSGSNNTPSSFDNILTAVAGNQFFDVKALQNIQTDDLRDAFNDWVEEEFTSNDNESVEWVRSTEEDNMLIATLQAQMQQVQEG